MKSSLLAVLLISASALAAEPGYYSQPALYGDRVVFVSEGDLWTAVLPADPSTPIYASRLTSAPGNEGWPTFSPDGKSIAFSAEYDGNVDVYTMPVDGGAPARLTFHPDPDVPLSFTPDGAAVLFRSARNNPFGRPELYRVPTAGGLEKRFDLGECSLASINSTGKRLLFTRWSNETWNWKRYRGGTAPDLWLADFDTGEFRQVTSDPANDLFPMWHLGRVYFLSDRDGFPNLWSDSAEGKDLKQHTRFAGNPAEPTKTEGYDLRWPRADAKRGGGRIVFAQAGGLAVFDAKDEAITRLDVRLLSDRASARQRFTPPMETITEFLLSPDGKRLLIGSRGELLSLPVGDSKAGSPQGAMQLTRSSFAREWGFAFIKPEAIALITDAPGEQQLAQMPADGSSLPVALTTDREDWLFPPVASPDGRYLAFADKTDRLHLLDLTSLTKQVVDQSEAWEIVDYRFSPDSQWIAYTKPMPNGFGMVMLYSVRTGRNFPVSDGLANDSEPRWDPAGKYLYFLSKRHLDPVMSELDFEHALVGTTELFALPLAADVAPPIPALARAAGLDLEAWAAAPPDDKKEEAGADKKAKDAKEENDDDDKPAADKKPAEDSAPPSPANPMRVDTDSLPARAYRLPIEPGNYRSLEALRGGILYLSTPTQGLLEEVWPAPPMGVPISTLHRYDLVKAEDKVLTEKTSTFALSNDGSTVAFAAEAKFTVIPSSGEGKPETVDPAAAQLRVDAAAEWKQMYNEAWRLQRDFYWAPNMAGVNWPAVKAKYEALLPRIGSRLELNDLLGQMIGELGTSHTYVWGGEPTIKPVPINVGLLGADLAWENGKCIIKSILPGQPWDESLVSPLAMPHLRINPGAQLVAINGVALTASTNPLDLLQDQAGKIVRLTIVDSSSSRPAPDIESAGGAIEPGGAEPAKPSAPVAQPGAPRTVEIKALGSERELRYAAWVEKNRRHVDKATEGKIGYLHIPDMDSAGLVAFSRLFYPQIDKKGLVVDIRDNGGGFVSQMIVQRLGRKVWAFQKPRQGATERYPARTLNGHIAVIIDQHAGSDGDIFPASFRMNKIGPLIGTRTWGGVVGIRGDKPFVDGGLSTQPEFAWWEPTGGWSLENEGVKPDIEVDTTPADHAAGKDPQLDRAIQWVMEELKRDPKDLPQPPAWPDRSRVKP
jgi:tricorn protease